MERTQYILTGFGDFFERQRIAFVDPLPRNHVCCACGFVSSLSVRLPCSHVLCRLCKSQIASDGVRCPVEGMQFKEDDIASQTVELPDLEHLRVFCINGGGSGQRCNFVGKLLELPAHVYECGNDEVKCENCDSAVTQNAAVDHPRQCSADMPLAGPTGKAAEVAAAEGDPGAVVEDVEKWRQHASGKQVDRQGFEKNADSSLAECVTDHRTHSIRAKRTSSGSSPIHAPPGLFRAMLLPELTTPLPSHVYSARGAGSTTYTRNMRSSDISTLLRLSQRVARRAPTLFRSSAHSPRKKSTGEWKCTFLSICAAASGTVTSNGPSART
ncbi:uncharacterized protein LOC142559667 [Dermacentor variabilis]|uniref:uncharacterized protein LOC142559667 n=1 Tax=Dermacentor variabilis TaxID=34621 RepID=UPI003F5BEAA6